MPGSMVMVAPLLLVLLHVVEACVQQKIQVSSVALSLLPGTLNGSVKIVASDNEEITLCAGSGVTLSPSSFFGDRSVTVTVPHPGLFAIELTAKIANCSTATTTLPIWADPGTVSTIGIETDCRTRDMLSLASQATRSHPAATILSVVPSASCAANAAGYLATSSSGQCRCSASLCASENRGPCVGTNATVHCSCPSPYRGNGINCTHIYYKPAQVGVAPKPQLTALTEHADCRANNGFLESPVGWCGGAPAPGDWIQADLVTPTWIGKVATRGRSGAHPQWVTSYRLEYSNSTTGFQVVGTFSGNTDNTNTASHEFTPVTARYWRLHALAFNSHPSLRFELYTYSLSLAHTAVGVGKAPKPSLTAQSQHMDVHASNGMLYAYRGWGSATGAFNEWIQADLLAPIWIGKIATQGRFGSGTESCLNQWTTSFIVQYSNDGSTFTQLGGTYPGNTDCYTPKFNDLGAGMTARYWRVLPTAANVYPVLRFELYTSP
eukprot:CAMPEP_0114549322 /NCGR_PEP_ID=MMETSP0114-20121206/5465_1 /TAXON_ID=31324 /ORGANISM="Goniomonas sp, Strain m" /LENGTH=492 /DNA_ID=CAMNT_0001733995 /DNA_START=16 /DNA_END=1494 /DNA_ORIENTATION=-